MVGIFFSKGTGKFIKNIESMHTNMLALPRIANQIFGGVNIFLTNW
jgi:hypothetical protein